MSGRRKRVAMASSSSLRVADVSGKSLCKVSQMVGVGVHSGVAAIVADNNNLLTLNGIEKYASLIQLSVRDNSLVRMEAVAPLSTLVTLNLQNNSITEIAGVGGLVNLQWLCLAGNSIKEMAGLSRNFKLTHLDLSDNCISQLADLAMLTELKTVLLHGNAISTLQRLPQYFPQSLETVTLAENELADLNEVWHLSSLSTLSQLSIMSNPCVSPAAASSVLFDYRPCVLYWCPSLTTLDGVPVTPHERQQSSSLFPPGHHGFTLGQHSELVAHLASFLHPPHLTAEHSFLSSFSPTTTTSTSLDHHQPSRQARQDARKPAMEPSRQEARLDAREPARQVSRQETGEASRQESRQQQPRLESDEDLQRKLMALQLLQEMISAQEQLLNASRSEDNPRPIAEAELVDAPPSLLVEDLNTTGLHPTVANSSEAQRVPMSLSLVKKQKQQNNREEKGRFEKEGRSDGEGVKESCEDVGRMARGDVAGKTLQERRTEQLKLINQKISERKKMTDQSAAALLPSRQSAPTISTRASSFQKHSPPPPPIARSKTDSQVAKNGGKDMSIMNPSLPIDPNASVDISGCDATANDSSEALESTSYYIPLHDSDIALSSIGGENDHIDEDETLLDLSSLASSITQAYGIRNSGGKSQLISALVGERKEQFRSWTRDMLQQEPRVEGGEGEKFDAQFDSVATMSGLLSPSKIEEGHSGTTSQHRVAPQPPPQRSCDLPLAPELKLPPADRSKLETPSSVNQQLGSGKKRRGRLEVSPEVAAVKIQAAVRGFLTHRIVQRYLIHVRAATVIQAAWRGYVARVRDPVVLRVRGHLSTAKLEAYVATLFIQLQGYTCRQELAHQAHLSQLQEEAVETLLTEMAALQQWKAATEEEHKRKAATVIQKHWRGHRVRKSQSFPSSSPPTREDLWALCSSLKEQVEQLQSAVSVLVEGVRGDGRRGSGEGRSQRRDALRLRYQRMGFLSPETSFCSEIESIADYLPVPRSLKMSHFSDTCLLLRWSPPSPSPPPEVARLQGYRVLVNGTPEGTVGPDKAKAYVEGLDPSTTYRVTIRAVFDIAESKDSNAVMASLTTLSKGKETEVHSDDDTSKDQDTTQIHSHASPTSILKTHSTSGQTEKHQANQTSTRFSKVAVAQTSLSELLGENADSDASGASQKSVIFEDDSLSKESSGLDSMLSQEEGQDGDRPLKGEGDENAEATEDCGAEIQPSLSVDSNLETEPTQKSEKDDKNGASIQPETVQTSHTVSTPQEPSVDPPPVDTTSTTGLSTVLEEDATGRKTEEEEEGGMVEGRSEELDTISGLQQPLTTTATTLSLQGQTIALQLREAHPVFEHTLAFDDITSGGSLTTQHMPTLMQSLSGEHGPTPNPTSVSARRLEGTTKMQNIGTARQPLKQELAYPMHTQCNYPIAAAAIDDTALIPVLLSEEHGSTTLNIQGLSQSSLLDGKTQGTPLTRPSSSLVPLLVENAQPCSVVVTSCGSIVVTSVVAGSIPSVTASAAVNSYTAMDSDGGMPTECGLLPNQVAFTGLPLKGTGNSIVEFSQALETIDKVEASTLAAADEGWNEGEVDHPSHYSFAIEELQPQITKTTMAHTPLTSVASPTEFVGCDGGALDISTGSRPASDPNTVTAVDGSSFDGNTVGKSATTDTCSPDFDGKSDSKSNLSAVDGPSFDGRNAPANHSTAAGEKSFDVSSTPEVSSARRQIDSITPKDDGGAPFDQSGGGAGAVATYSDTSQGSHYDRNEATTLTGKPVYSSSNTSPAAGGSEGGAPTDGAVSSHTAGGGGAEAASLLLSQLESELLSALL